MCASVGVLGHELVDELIERLDPIGGGAAVEDLRAPRVPGCEVAESAFAFVLMLGFLAFAAPGGTGLGLALARLDRGLLIGADDVVAGMQAFALPGAGVEVEDRPGALCEQRVARKIQERCFSSVYCFVSRTPLRLMFGSSSQVSLAWT